MKRALLLVCAACARPVASPGPSPATSTHATATLSDGWANESWEDRHDTMTFLVLPEMARAFQRFESKPYPDLTCFSCHGADAEKLQYRMPAGPPLDPAHLPRKDSPNPSEAKVAAFMSDEVMPALAQMLRKPDIGCFTCHTKRSP